MNVTAADYIGLLGAAACLFAFAEVALGRWNGKSFWFEFNNFFGSLLLIYYAVNKQAYISIILNVVWGAFALYSIQHIIKRHKHRQKHTTKRRKTAKR